MSTKRTERSNEQKKVTQQQQQLGAIKGHKEIQNDKRFAKQPKKWQKNATGTQNDD